MTDKNLLVFHQGALGDFVLTFPALMRLKKHFTPVDAVCKPQLGELARALGLIDHWFSQDASRFASLFSDTIEPDVKDLLRAYDEMILFSFSNDLTRSINQIRRRPAHQIAPRPDRNENVHVAVHLLQNLKRRGLIAQDQEMDSPGQIAFHMQPAGIRSGLDSRKILLHPGAGSQEKMWPLSNFLQVEELLLSDQYQPEFILGPADRFLEDALKMPNVRQDVVHTPETIMALRDLLKTAGGYIGNDSGVSHLAAYLGLPTVTVFGPSNPHMWRPIGPRVAVVQSRFHHQPEGLPGGDNPDSLEVFAGVTPAAVMDAFYRLFSLPGT